MVTDLEKPLVRKHRSPNYPALDLERSIELVGKVYAAVLKAEVNLETALHVMGYRGVSGASRTAIGAARQFGLIEGRGDSYKVTDLAISILRPLDDNEKAESVRIASKQPEVYREILEQFSSAIPAEPILKSYLVRKHGFGESGAASVVAGFLSTMKFAEGFQKSEPLATSLSQSPPAKSKTQGGSAQDVSLEHNIREADLAGQEILDFRLSKNTKVKLIFSTTPSEKDIQRLSQLILALAVGYAESEE